MQELSLRPKNGKFTVVIGNVFLAAARKGKKNTNEQMEFVFISLRNITRVLILTAVNKNDAGFPATLPVKLKGFENLFNDGKASVLPPHKGELDYYIRI